MKFTKPALLIFSLLGAIYIVVDLLPWATSTGDTETEATLRSLGLDPHNSKEKQFPCVVSFNPGGGFGDRLRNVVFGFYLSVLFDRKYSMIENFLGDSGAVSPKFDGLNWTDTIDLQNVKSEEEFTFIDLDWHRNIILKINMTEANLRPVWRVYTNVMDLSRELQLHPQVVGKKNFAVISQLAAKGELFHFALQSLISPSKNLTNLIHKVWEEETKSRQDHYFKVGIQIRSGDNDEIVAQDDEFEKMSLKREKRYTREVPREYYRCFFFKALEVINRRKGDKKVIVFITADSEKTNKQFSTWFSEQEIQSFDTEKYAGRVKHAGRTTGDQSRTFLDWFLLTQMDHILISQSGFSETAAKYNCNPVSFFFNVPSIHSDVLDEGTCLTHFLEYASPGLCRSELDVKSLATYVAETWPQQQS